MSEIVLNLKNIQRNFTQAGQVIEALKNINLYIVSLLVRHHYIDVSTLVRQWETHSHRISPNIEHIKYLIQQFRSSICSAIFARIQHGRQI